jgi:hypothetical protein
MIFEQQCEGICPHGHRPALATSLRTPLQWLWSAWLWLFLSQSIRFVVAMTSFFEFALALVIPGARLILLAALLLTRST